MFTATLTALTLVAGIDPEPAAGPVKILARADWPRVAVDVNSAGNDKVQHVIRAAAELPGAGDKAVAAELAKALKVKEIDWAKQMVLLVSGGTRPTGGFRVEVTSVEIAGKTMTVKWKLHAPKGLATQAFTHPAEVVLVPKFAGKVAFDPAK